MHCVVSLLLVEFNRSSDDTEEPTPGGVLVPRSGLFVDDAVSQSNAQWDSTDLSEQENYTCGKRKKVLWRQYPTSQSTEDAHLSEVVNLKNVSCCRTAGCSGKARARCVLCKVSLCLQAARNCYTVFQMWPAVTTEKKDISRRFLFTRNTRNTQKSKLPRFILDMLEFVLHLSIVKELETVIIPPWKTDFKFKILLHNGVLIMFWEYRRCVLICGHLYFFFFFFLRSFMFNDNIWSFYLLVKMHKWLTNSMFTPY